MCPIDELRHIVEEPFDPAAEDLASLADAAKRRDDLAYKTSVRIVIKSVLLKLEDALIADESLWEGQRVPTRDDEKQFFLSLHFESAILHDRLRTLSDSGNWARWTDRSETEIDRFREFYRLDPRQGHLLTDPQMKQDLLHLVFHPDNETIDVADIICVAASVWNKAHKMLDSLAFLVLLGLRPNTDVDEADFSNLIDYLHSAIPERIRYPKPSDPLAPIDANLKRQQVRSFLLTFYFTIATSTKVTSQRVLIWTYHDSAFLQNWSISEDGIATRKSIVPKLGSLALVILGVRDTTSELPALTSRGVQMLQAAGRRFVELIRVFELDACLRVPGVAASASDEEDRIRIACQLPSDPENLDILIDLCRPLHDKIRGLMDPDAAVHDNTAKAFLDKCGLVGASSLMIDLVDRLYIAAENSKTDEVTSIFTRISQMECF